jgi:hypothetical protein
MPLNEREYMKPRRRAVRVGKFNLGWPYCIIVTALGANWLWDIWDRVLH